MIIFQSFIFPHIPLGQTCIHIFPIPDHIVHTFHSWTLILFYFIYFFYVFLLQTREMHEAAIHQIKAELRCGKKETRILLKEAQQEYDSQSTYHFCYFHCSKLISIHSILSFFIIYFFPLPLPNLSPGETLHALVVLSQHDLTKLKSTEKL